MLHAVLHGKAGRVTVEGEDRSWRDLFRNREDLLTATFFGRLRYLTEDGERKVLALLVGEKLADEFGPIQETIFWPKLIGLEDRQHVEPDVVLIFDKTLLLIEVKPPFGGNQHEGQWRAQIKSLIQQRQKNDAPFEVSDEFHFLALGRNMPRYPQVTNQLLRDYRTEGLQSVHPREWAEVCDAAHELVDSEEGRDRAVYTDWIEAFTLFGMVEKPRSFTDLLKFTKAIRPKWRVELQAFEEPKFERVQPRVDWQPLVELGQGMNLDGRIWL